MKIFIFGAGASFGAHMKDLDSYKIPPLTKDIFQGCRKYDINYSQKIGLNINDLNYIEDESANFREEDNSVDIEAWLTDKLKKARSLDEGLHKDSMFNNLGIITFYIWNLLLSVSEVVYRDEKLCRGSNLYRKFLKRIQDEGKEFGIINFNYDLLLDFAIKDTFGFTLQTLDNYLNRNYIKPHGSVNWLINKRETDRNIEIVDQLNLSIPVHIKTAAENMYKGGALSLGWSKIIEPDDKNLYDLSSLLKKFNSQYFYPLIFLPIKAKNYQTVEGFETKITKKTKELLSKATELYFIGYRARDRFILELLKNTPLNKIKLFIFNKSSSKKIAKRINVNNKFKSIYARNKEFKDFVLEYSV